MAGAGGPLPGVHGGSRTPASGDMQNIITYPAAGRYGMRTLTVAVLALVVLLAGCGGAAQSGPTTTDAASPTTTDDRSPSMPVTDTERPAGTSTPTETAPPPTTEAWTPPEEPASPIENATGPNRISRVDFYGTEDGGNFSEFDVAAYANTSTAALGEAEDGPAYFFVWVEGEPIARTEVVSRRNETLTTVPVPEAGLDRFDPGRLAVRVELLRAGEDGTVRHGRWNGTVTYWPGGNQSS